MRCSASIPARCVGRRGAEPAGAARYQPDRGLRRAPQAAFGAAGLAFEGGSRPRAGTQSCELAVEQSHELALLRQPPHAPVGAVHIHRFIEDGASTLLRQGMKDALMMPHGSASACVQNSGKGLETSGISIVMVGLGVARVPRSMECLQRPGIVYWGAGPDLSRAHWPVAASWRGASGWGRASRLAPGGGMTACFVGAAWR